MNVKFPWAQILSFYVLLWGFGLAAVAIPNELWAQEPIKPDFVSTKDARRFEVFPKKWDAFFFGSYTNKSDDAVHAVVPVVWIYDNAKTEAPALVVRGVMSDVVINPPMQMQYMVRSLVFPGETVGWVCIVEQTPPRWDVYQVYFEVEVIPYGPNTQYRR